MILVNIFLILLKAQICDIEFSIKHYWQIVTRMMIENNKCIIFVDQLWYGILGDILLSVQKSTLSLVFRESIYTK